MIYTDSFNVIDPQAKKKHRQRSQDLLHPKTVWWYSTLGSLGILSISKRGCAWRIYCRCMGSFPIFQQKTWISNCRDGDLQIWTKQMVFDDSIVAAMRVTATESQRWTVKPMLNLRRWSQQSDRSDTQVASSQDYEHRHLTTATVTSIRALINKHWGCMWRSIQHVLTNKHRIQLQPSYHRVFLPPSFSPQKTW
jgi:hypothetical protein